MFDLRILVVEDKQKWQDALKPILLRLGSNVNVDSATTYEGALQSVTKEKYDLIIVDLALHEDHFDLQNIDQRGMELLEVVHNDQNNKHCGLIVLTAYGNILRAKQALRDYAVYDFIEKDQFVAQNFVEIARAAIREARLNRAEARAKARVRLTVTFNQEYLIGCELTGPNQRAVYPAANRRRLKTTELIHRADRLNILVLSEDADVWRPELRSLGNAIHEALFKEQCFQTSLITAQAVTSHPGDLWLQFSGLAKELGIPFELLYNGNGYLGRTHILTRQLVQSGQALLHRTEPFHAFITRLVKRNEPLRILIVGADADSTIPAAEREAIALKTSIESTLKLLGIPCDVDMLMGISASHDKVSEALRYGHYHIFHYAGHGLYDETLPEISGLVLHKNNDLRVLTAADLNTLVRDSELRMVFLNCCLGARNASHLGRGDFYGMLEAVARAGVPTVLGYRWTVLDSSAMRLAEAFYETLWHTFSSGEALLEARIQATLGLKGLDDETWAAPVLVVQNA